MTFLWLETLSVPYLAGVQGRPLLCGVLDAVARTTDLYFEEAYPLL